MKPQQIKEVTIYGSNKWSDLKPLNLSKINFVDFPKDHYFSSPNDIYPKNQICIHHTVSGPGTRGDINTWLSTFQRIATCVIIERDGNIDQLFGSQYWGAHIGAGNLSLDKHSIGIELDSWGQLKLDNNGKYRTVYGNVVDVPIVHYPEGFRDYQYFEAYPEAQLRSLGELLLFWNRRYKIPLDYKEDMWNVSQRALSGVAGVWTHVSYRLYPQRNAKYDCHPDPNLISLLRTIPSLV